MATDVIFQGQAHGSVASRLMAANFDVRALRPTLKNNGLLRKDEWKAMDEAVIPVYRERLVANGDLINAGLVYNITNGLGSTVLETEKMSDIQGASLSMDGAAKGENDAPVYTTEYLPLPIIHFDFHLNIRTLMASRTKGSPLDTTIAEMAARQVAEKQEEILVSATSASLTYGGGSIYSYLSAPNINTVTLAQNWDASGKTGEEILTDVLALKQALIDDRRYGPYVLYIPTAYETVLDDEFKTNSDRSIRERLNAVEGLSAIKVVDHLPANTVLMVQMTSDVVRLVQGMPLTTVQWDSGDGMRANFKVMTIAVPQIRSDANSRSGIVKLA